jgi:CRP/FNR family cyclic AMP-dependent transcriptional regulator
MQRDLFMLASIPSPDSTKVIPSLLHLCHVRSYPAKTTIIRPGDVGDRLHFIIDGSVSVCAEDDDGHELILAYLNKNEFIGEIGVFRGTEIREVTVKTRAACKLAEIGYDRLHHAIHHELKEHATELLTLLGEQLASRLLTTSRKYCDLAFMDVEGRVARALLDLTKDPDAITHPDGMQLHITRQEISRIVGCSREMVGRILKEMESKSLISAHGKTIVIFGTR